MGGVLVSYSAALTSYTSKFDPAVFDLSGYREMPLGQPLN